MMVGNELWRHFESTCCSNRELLHRVLSFLDYKHQANLRLSNKRLCDAVSEAVDEVLCTLHNGSVDASVSRAFPAITHLALRISPEDSDASRVTAAEIYLFLQHFSATNSATLPRLTKLTVDMVLPGELTINVHSAFCSFLTRCANLESLDVLWIDYEQHQAGNASNVTAFAGHGSTPIERRATMQQQLASITSSPEFLAPASWPTHNCLTKLHLIPFILPQPPIMRASGLCTTSLVSLLVHTAQAAELVQCQGLSRLSRLTSLELFANTNEEADGGPLRDLLEEVSQLPSLVYLGIDGYVLDRAAVETFVPGTWAQLTCLTCLCFHEATVPLSSLPVIPTLQNLYLGRCTVLGSLSQLSALTALRILEAKPAVPLDDDGAQVQQDAAGVNGLAGLGAAPRAWQDSLCDLSWDFNWADMHVISQLVSLTSLTLVKPEVGPELCWQLAALSKLRHLALLHAKAPPQPTTYFAGRRSRMPLLETIDAGTPHSLRELVQWTDVGPGLSFTDTTLFARNVPLPFRDLGAGWLAALVAPLAPGSRPLGTEGFGPPAYLVLHNDATVTQLLQELEDIEASSKCTNLALLLGDVSPDALGRLLEAAHVFPHGSVRVTNSPHVDYQPFLFFGDRLPHDHYWNLRGVSAPGLRMLQLDSCGTLLHDQHMALLAAAAPNLRMLKLGDAGALTGATLFALVACRELVEVTITGSGTTFSGHAVTTLLDSSSKLISLVVGNADMRDVRASLARHPAARCAPEPLEECWSVNAVGMGVVECLRNLRREDLE